MALISKPVLTVDIVNFSTRSVREQTELIRVFIQMLNESIPSDHNHPAHRIWSPAGDGGALTFWESLLAPIETAIALSERINEYNRGAYMVGGEKKSVKSVKRLQVRIGIHIGPVSKEIDFDKRENIWGDGINVSARVAGLAQPDQILVSEEYYRDAQLFDFPTIPNMKVDKIGKGWAKHNKSIELYNVCTLEVGLPMTETDDWFRPLNQPLENAVRTYKGMLEEEYNLGKAFRVGVIAKRILDLDPKRPSIVDIGTRKFRVDEIITHISESVFNSGVGQRTLFDPFFSKLSPLALSYFFQNAFFQVSERGEVIAVEGEDADTLMIIVSGAVGIYKKGENGAESKLRIVDTEIDKEVDVVFQEGDIVGEMGLFNEGEKRSATMRAERSTMLLSIKYVYLREVASIHNIGENTSRGEIKKQVWDYYARRTIDNQVNYHRLFRLLPSQARAKIKLSSIFFPVNYREGFEFNIEELNKWWLVVVSGSVLLTSKSNNKSLQSNRGDCIGPVYLVTDSMPYTDISFTLDIQLIAIPVVIIDEIIQGDSLSESVASFRNSCVIEGYNERKRLALR